MSTERGSNDATSLYWSSFSASYCHSSITFPTLEYSLARGIAGSMSIHSPLTCIPRRLNVYTRLIFKSIKLVRKVKRARRDESHTSFRQTPSKRSVPLPQSNPILMNFSPRVNKYILGILRESSWATLLSWSTILHWSIRSPQLLQHISWSFDPESVKLIEIHSRSFFLRV